MTKNRLKKLLVASDVFEDNSSDDNSNSDDDNVLLPPEGRVISGEHIDFDTSSSGDLTSNEVPSERGVRQSRQAVDHVDGNPLLITGSTPPNYLYANVRPVVQEYFRFGQNPNENYFIGTNITGNLNRGINNPYFKGGLANRNTKQNYNIGGCNTFDGGLGIIQQWEGYSSLTYDDGDGNPTNGWGNTYVLDNKVYFGVQPSDKGLEHGTLTTITDYSQVPTINTKNNFPAQILQIFPSSANKGKMTPICYKYSICDITKSAIGNGQLKSNIEREYPLEKSNNIKQAEINFMKMVRWIEYMLNNRFKSPLSQNVFNALADMCFPMGQSIFTHREAQVFVGNINLFFSQMVSIQTKETPDEIKRDLITNNQSLLPTIKIGMNAILVDANRIRITSDSEENSIKNDGKTHYVEMDGVFYQIIDLGNYIRIGNDFNNIMRSIKNNGFDVDEYYYKHSVRSRRQGVINEGQ